MFSRYNEKNLIFLYLDVVLLGFRTWVYKTKLEMDYTGPEVIKLFSCSAQLSMKFSLLINVKMPTIIGILIFMSRKNSILGLSESE